MSYSANHAWNNFKRGYIYRHHPLRCAACDTHISVELHHIVPISEPDSPRNVDSNIIALCRHHHFVIGHNSNWSISNPNVVRDVALIRSMTKKD